jgi:hypothetical protein
LEIVKIFYIDPESLLNDLILLVKRENYLELLYCGYLNEKMEQIDRPTTIKEKLHDSTDCKNILMALTYLFSMQFRSKTKELTGFYEP